MACTTNMDKVLVSRMPAEKLTLSMMSLTRLCTALTINQFDEGHLPFATHQGTDSCRFAEIEFGKLGSTEASDKLGKEGDGADEEGVPPSFASVE